jgi:integrase
VIAYLAKLRSSEGCLPGNPTDAGSIEIDWRHIERLFGSSGLKYNGTGRLILESGLPIDPNIPLDVPVSGVLDGNPWRNSPIGYHEAPQLGRLLSTACFIVIAYLSGARPGEILSLRRGCLSEDPDTGLLLMGGRYYKNAVDTDGNKLPQGEERADPWVVVAPVARAIEVLERLHSSPLLFPTRIEAYHSTSTRLGTARDVQKTAEDITAFIRWVNTHCTRLGRADAIPADRHGTLAPSRFRRTLAWFIRRRPRGLVAASVQYGHVQVQMLQGYAGSYASGFPDEYAFEDWLYRMETTAEDERALAGGEHVSGPAADAYRHRVTAAHRTFSGRVLTSAGQSRDLLGNPLLQIHHGRGMTCVLNPATAACQLRGTADDPLVTPDTDDCRPRVPQHRTHRPRHRPRRTTSGGAGSDRCRPPRPFYPPRTRTTRTRPPQGDPRRPLPGQKTHSMNDAPVTAPETDPVRRAILAAMDRMLSGCPQRSTGRLNVSQLAVEADIKRWQLTHQHTDLRDLFQSRAHQAEDFRGTHQRTLEERDDLRRRYADLKRYCSELEERVQAYATVINLMALEYEAVTEQNTNSARVLPLPSQQPPRT